MLLTVSETGLGKRTDFAEYPRHSRGGQGVLTHNVTARTGRVVAARAVRADNELIVISVSGIVMRTDVDSIAKVGRSAQGVQVMHPPAGDSVASIAVIDMSKAPPPPTAGEIANAAAAQANDIDGAPRARRTPNRRNGN
jgi:DNA gyrase subunit A